MKYFDPAKTANQTFEIQVKGYLVSFYLHTFRELMYVDISVGDENIVNGLRVVKGEKLLPPKTERMLGGNFFFMLLGDGYPSFEDFDGVKCRLAFTGEE